MELLKFTWTIKNLRNINESLIPFYLNNNNYGDNCYIDIIKIWNKILLKKLFNNTKHGFKLNYIKLIVFSTDIIIIVDDYNNLIIIDIHKCKSLLGIIIKNQMLIKSNIKNLLNDQDEIDDKYDLFSSCNTSKTNKNKKKICYENIFTIKKIKNNINNIIKIDIISVLKTSLMVKKKHYSIKIIILTEDHKLYSWEILNNLYFNINNSSILLLSEDVHDYYLFGKVILIRKTTKENEKNELYFLVSIDKIWLYLGSGILLNNENENAIIVKKRNNIIKRIHNEFLDHYLIIDIGNNFDTYNLEIPKKKYYADSWTDVIFSYKIKNDNAILNSLSNLNDMTISAYKKMLNGILISYYSPLTGFYIRCIINGLANNNGEFIIIKTKFNNIHYRIMHSTYYIIRNDIYLNFIQFGGSSITYDITTNGYVNRGNEIVNNNNIVNRGNEIVNNNNIIHYD